VQIRCEGVGENVFFSGDYKSSVQRFWEEVDDIKTVNFLPTSLCFWWLTFIPFRFYAFHLEVCRTKKLIKTLSLNWRMDITFLSVWTLPGQKKTFGHKPCAAGVLGAAALDLQLSCLFCVRRTTDRQTDISTVTTGLCLASFADALQKSVSKHLEKGRQILQQTTNIFSVVTLAKVLAL